MNKPTKRLLAALLTCIVVGLIPARAQVAPSAGPPRQWALLPWDQAVGRVIGHEASSEGPKSFAVKPDGGVLLLDQVNQRILDLDPAGKLVGTMALPATTFDDVEQVDGRAVLVLDRLVRKSLLVMDRQGAILSETPIEGRGIERGGMVTALLPRPDGVWLEVEHRHSVKVLNHELRPCERQVILGRPLPNGQSLRGTLDHKGGVSLSVGARTERNLPEGAHLSSGAPLRRIVWLDAAPKGPIYTVVHEIARDSAPPFRTVSEQYWLVALDSNLHELGRIASPWVLTEYDQEVEFRVGPDGRLWQMAFTPEGVMLLDWGRRAP